MTLGLDSSVFFHSSPIDAVVFENVCIRGSEKLTKFPSDSSKIILFETTSFTSFRFTILCTNLDEELF